jgi:hypothetical protein
MGINNQKWRLNNLYRIIDKNSNSIPFRLNPIQEDVLDNLHNRNLILKARQLGMSTFAVLLLTDSALFTENLTTGVVSYSLDHAKHIFNKIIGHALDTLPKEIRHLAGIQNRSAKEVGFNNGSSIHVDTSLRGGTCNLALISEFGKICARNPLKAQEVITGTLQSIPKNGTAIIESTAEGSEGYFAEMVTESYRRGNDNLTSLDFKLFFYNWLQDPNYIMDENVSYDIHLTDYFAKIEKELGISISKERRNWYAAQHRLLGDKIKQEYPSTIGEAFLASSDAYYFAESIAKAYDENRCLNSPLYDYLLPMYVAMDIGVNDLTVMVFFQIAHGEIRIVDYYEDKNKDVPFYVQFLLQEKKFLYHTIFLPHDSKKRSQLDITNSYEHDFRRLLTGTSTKVIVLPKMDKQISISHSRLALNRCVFNLNRVKKFLDHVAKYRKTWSEATGRWLEEPLHDISSNYADAFRYLCQAAAHIETVSSYSGALDKHRKAVESRYKAVI